MCTSTPDTPKNCCDPQSMAEGYERLREMERRLNIAQVGHLMASERFHKLNMALYLPLFALTLVIAACTFLDSDPFWKVVLQVAGIAAAAMSFVQPVLRFGERAETHRLKGARYGSLKRQVEFHLLKQPNMTSMAEFSNTMLHEWNSVAEDSPLTPARIVRKAEAKFPKKACAHCQR